MCGLGGASRTSARALSASAGRSSACSPASEADGAVSRLPHGVVRKNVRQSWLRQVRATPFDGSAIALRLPPRAAERAFSALPYPVADMEALKFMKYLQIVGRESARFVSFQMRDLTHFSVFLRVRFGTFLAVLRDLFGTF